MDSSPLDRSPRWPGPATAGGAGIAGAHPARLRVAVVGVGHLGSVHASIWAADPRAHLVAVLDLDPGRAREAAARYGCQVAGSLAELQGSVDAVCVVTPADQHAPASIPLLERGLACLVEKPLASDGSSAAAVVAAARRGGAFLTVGHSERYQPALRRFRDLGLEPRRLEFERHVTASGRGREVSVVHDLMIHDLDLAMELFGAEPEAIEPVHLEAGLSERAEVRLHFPGGRVAELRANRSSPRPHRRCLLAGTGFQAELDLLASTLRVEGDQEIGMRVEELPRERSLQAELADFRERLQARRDPPISGQAGLRAVRWADAIAGLSAAPPRERRAV
jgi:predicted dehydrogenase